MLPTIISNENQARIDRIAALGARLRPQFFQQIRQMPNIISGEKLHGWQNIKTTLLFSNKTCRCCCPCLIKSNFYAETSIHSALGFWLEIAKRIGHRLFPTPPDNSQLTNILQLVFIQDTDYQWISAVNDATWLELAAALDLHKFDDDNSAMLNVIEATRVLSYRVAGVALDRELLIAEPMLEYFDSPFLAQNATLVPILERIRMSAAYPAEEEFREVDVLLDQCIKVLDRARRKAVENGISVRLTYLLARLHQLIRRQRELMEFMVAENRVACAIKLMKTLSTAVQTGHHIKKFTAESMNLISRNITDHAGRHGGTLYCRRPCRMVGNGTQCCRRRGHHRRHVHTEKFNYLYFIYHR